MAYTSDDFVTEVKRDFHLPASQPQWTPANILAVADKMLLRRVIPALIGVGDGYYRETVDVTLVAGQASYDLPRYAMYNNIHQALLTNAAGDIAEIEVIGPSDLRHRNSVGTGNPRTLHFEANQVTLNPAPSAGSLSSWPTLRLWIYRRPGRLVPVSSAAKVLTVVGTTVTYTSTKPTTFSATSVHDFYNGESPFRRVGSAITATGSPGGTQQTFASANAALLSVDDYVCVRDETVFPDCAIEVVPFLQELTGASISKSQGDSQALETSIREIVQDMMQAIGVSANRAEAQARTLSLLHSPFVRRSRRRGMPSTPV